MPPRAGGRRTNSCRHESTADPGTPYGTLPNHLGQQRAPGPRGPPESIPPLDGPRRDTGGHELPQTPAPASPVRTNLALDQPAPPAVRCRVGWHGELRIVSPDLRRKFRMVSPELPRTPARWPLPRGPVPPPASPGSPARGAA